MMRRLAMGILLTCSTSANAQTLCPFELAKFTYAGSAREQTACLTPNFSGPADRFSDVSRPRTSVPEPLGSFVGAPVAVDPAKLAAALKSNGMAVLADTLDKPLSTTPAQIPARYFVLHDTSAFFGKGPIPLDRAPAMTRLGDKWQKGPYTGDWVAHVFVNRLGASLVAYDYAVRVRRGSTRFENLHPETLGLFLHTELVQGRFSPPGRKGDSGIETPAFTPAQYKIAALLYLTASVRAHVGLIPAYHIVIDHAIPGGHDDPQHFDLDAFSAQLAAWLAAVR